MNTLRPLSRLRTVLVASALLAFALLTAGCGGGGGGGKGAAKLVGLEITPPAPSIAHGFTQALVATGRFKDHTTRNLTAEVTWSSDNAAAATVSNAAGSQGLVSTHGVGDARITVTDAATGLSTSITFAVTPAVLVRVEVTPPSASIANGFSQAFVATGVFSDDTTQNLTSSLAWSTLHPSIATVGTTVGTYGVAGGVALGTTSVVAEHTASGLKGSAGLTITPAVLVSIAVDPPAPEIALGHGQQFTATGTFSDHTTQNLTTAVTWSSSNTAAATIDNTASSQGLATSVAVGTTTITATHPGTNIAGTTVLSVSPAVLTSITVDPATPSIDLGRTQQLTATATFSDGTTQDVTNAATWTTSTPAIATVSNAAGSRGLATSAAVGSTTITATDPGTSIAGSTSLAVTPAVLVSIAVEPTSPQIALGYEQQFTATGTFSDQTTQDITSAVTWTSSNILIATVSNAASSRGLATSASVGSTTISATEPGTGVEGSMALLVTPPVLVSIAIDPATPQIALGYAQQFTANGTFSDQTTQDITLAVTWTSSSPAIATVSNADGVQGLATSASTGTTTIAAMDPATGVEGSTTLEITPAVLLSIGVEPISSSVALGYGQQFTATGTFSDNTTQDLTTNVTWSSSNAAAATISNTTGSEGYATSLTEGSTTIAATDAATNVSGSTAFDVTPAVLLSIVVDPAAPQVALGYDQQFTATGTFSDNSVRDITSSVTWSSSNSNIATISNVADREGFAVSVEPGQTTITATDPITTIFATATLQVSVAVLVSISLDPPAPAAALGYDVQFTATGTFSDDSTQDVTSSVTWSSSAPTIASVSNASGSHGRATTLSSGSTTITATDSGTNVSGSTSLLVSAAVLVSIGVDPVTPSIALGYGQQFTATGTFSDNSTHDVTASVTWGSSNAAVATIGNSSGSQGLATSAGAGSTTITATDSATSVAASTTLFVSPAVLVSISLDPLDPTISLGYGQQFTASGTFSDNTVLDVTADVTWTTSNLAIASISNASGSHGYATSAATGSTTITATDSSTSVEASTTLFVSQAVLLSIAVDPPNPSIATGYGQQFTAMGTFSDNSSRDLTATVTWSSSNAAVASISNTVGTEGMATGLSNGSSTITATDSATSVAGSTTLFVSGAVLVSMTVAPIDPTISLGFDQQFTATGTFSDNSSRPITTSVTWSSSSPAIASVSNASGSEGLATSASMGSTTITATDSATSVAASTTLFISQAVLTSIAITPIDPSIALGYGQQFTANGTFSDNSVQDITTQVTWSVANPAIATISNTVGSQGLASSVAQGSTTITAIDVATSLQASTSILVGAPIVYRNSSTTTGMLNQLSIDVATPSNVVAGEVMIAAIAIRPRSASITAPSGWTLIRRTDNSPPNPNSLAVYRRVATASEPASYTWGFSTAHGSAGTILRFQGVNTTTIVDAENGVGTTQALTHATPSITTTTPNTMIVTVHSMSSSATWTPPAGMTEVLDVASDTIPNSTGVAMTVSCEFQAAAGATGTRTATASNNPATGIGYILALRH